MVTTNYKFIYEVIELVSQAKTQKEKVDLLRKYESWALKDVLRGAYDDLVQWSLPPGPPPYEPAKENSVPSTMHNQHKKFKYFVKGLVGDSVHPIRREKMFIDMLESVHPKDAELLILMKDKKNLAKTVTRKLVQEAFPNLIVK
jgi:hypothetical protein